MVCISGGPMIWYRPKTYAMPTMPSAEPTIELRQRWTRKGPSASVPRRTYMRVTRSSPSIVVLNSRASSPTRCQRIPSSSADSISARISMIGQFRVSEPMTGRFGLARLTSSGVTSATPIAATRLGVASTMACLVSSCMPRERSAEGVVGRLAVTVPQAGVVDTLQGGRSRGGDLGREIQINRPADGPQIVAQRAIAHVAHRDVHDRVVFVEVIHLDDVGVVQRGE